MAELVTQFKIEVDDKTGLLAEMTDKIKDAGVNIRSLIAWVQDSKGHLMLLVDEADKFCKIDCGDCLKHESLEAVCLELDDEVGALNIVARKLADAGIAIKLCCAMAAGGKALTLLVTSDNARAVEIL